jgi:hypothetical protein
MGFLQAGLHQDVLVIGRRVVNTAMLRVAMAFNKGNTCNEASDRAELALNYIILYIEMSQRINFTNCESDTFRTCLRADVL